jgi:hypothetical protein
MQSPSMGLLRRPTPGEIMEDGRFHGPYGPGAHSRAIPENQPTLRRHSHISSRYGANCIYLIWSLMRPH